MIEYEDIELGEITVKICTPERRGGNEHRVLHISAPGYQTWLDRWSDSIPEGGWVSHPIPDVPAEALAAFSHVGLVLELTAERVRRELVKSAKEHDVTDVTDDDDTCGLTSVDVISPIDIDELLAELETMDKDEPDAGDGLKRAQRVADMQRPIRRAIAASFAVTRTSAVWASIPADSARLWERRVERWLAEADAELRK